MAVAQETATRTMNVYYNALLYCVGQAAVGESTKISLIISKVLGILNLEIKKKKKVLRCQL